MAVAVQRSVGLVESRHDLARATKAAMPMRWLALAIDLSLIGLVATVFGNVFGVTTVIDGAPPPPASTGFFSFTTATLLPRPWPSVVLVACFLVAESLFGTSPGKAITGLRIARVDGNRPGPAALAVRNLFRIADLLGFSFTLIAVAPLPVLGGFVAYMTPLRQRLGDLVAGTVVLERHHPHVAWWPALPHRNARIGALCLAVTITITGLVAFDYYGRPPLVIAGMRNTGSLPDMGSGYRIGSPTWGAGTVTVPYTFVNAKGTGCSGAMSLRWAGIVEGWIPTSGSSSC
jgi:uncharacterized RDD family membrane protein YckC